MGVLEVMHVTGDVFEVEIGLWVTCVVTLKVKWGLGGGLEVTHVTRDDCEVRSGM